MTTNDDYLKKDVERYVTNRMYAEGVCVRRERDTPFGELYFQTQVREAQIRASSYYNGDVRLMEMLDAERAKEDDENKW